jgi:hypothetical protein
MDKTYRILIGGMGRAGSSVLWKIACRILRGAEIPAEEALGGNIQNIVELDNCVMKIHPHDKKLHEWADVILTPRRDLRELVSSRVKAHFDTHRHLTTVDMDFIRDTCNQAMSLYSGWAEHSHYEMIYERFRDNPEEIVMEIADVMGLDCDPADILDQVGRPPEKKVFCITQEQIEFIEQEYKGWMEEHGYA